MRLDLLWWRHRRPRPPRLAPAPRFNYTQIIDMDAAISALDPDTSPANPGYSEVTVGNTYGIAVGTLLMDPKDGSVRRVEFIRRKTSDDWFEEDSWILGLRKPWIEPSAVPKISWMEDDMFPWMEDDMFPRLAGLTPPVP